MAYAVLQDAVDLYGEEYVNTSVDLTDDDPPVPDTASLTKTLINASSEIDSYLVSQYTTPIASPPAIVVQYCVDIGIYRASSNAGTGTDEKRLRYEDAIKWLLNVAKGVISLALTEDDTSTQGQPAISGPSRIFSRSTMRGL